MKKVDLNEYVTNTELIEASAEALKNINGGCTIYVGRCKKDGTYYISSVSEKCVSYSSHAKRALSAAKAVGLYLGQIKSFTIIN